MSIILFAIADRLLEICKRLAPAKDRDWLAAMKAELRHIDRAPEALAFSLGCLRACWSRRMTIDRYEPLARWGLAACLFFWAAGKLYLWTVLPETWSEVSRSQMKLAMIGGASLAYAGAGWWLLKKAWVVCAMWLLAAFLLNSAHLGIIASTTYQPAGDGMAIAFSLAVIAEDYFIWALALAGGLALWAFPKLIAGRKAI